MKISFLGLGVMGYPMAGHLQKAGYKVCVYNRTTAKAEQWVEQYGGTSAVTPAKAVADADVVFMCLGNDQDVYDVVTGNDGVLSALKPNAILVDHTTTSSALAKKLQSVVKDKNADFIDAPLSGGQAGAENAQLVIMAGADNDVLQRITPIMQSYAKSIIHMGDVGAGQATKMVNQVLVAGVLQGMAEGFILAEKSGLELSKVLDAVSGGAAGSWQLSNRGMNIHNEKFDYGFAIDWMRKDLGFCLEAAKGYGVDLPNAQWVDECYAKLQEKGYNRCDTSILVKQYENKK